MQTVPSVRRQHRPYALATSVVVASLLSVLMPRTAQGGSPLHVEMRPALGQYYRPGAWLLVRARVDIPARRSGIFVPQLEVLATADAPPLFSSRLAPLQLQEGETYSLGFWIMAGETPPLLRLQLTPLASGAALVSDVQSHVLRPLPAERRLVLSPDALGPSRGYLPAELPDHPALYESCDVLVLGRLAAGAGAPTLSAAQLNAITGWVARGGIVLVLAESTGTALERAAAAMGFRVGRRFPFVLPQPPHLEEPEAPPPASRLGRGLVVHLSAMALGDRARLGEAVWQRVEREILPKPVADLRLQKRRYDALGPHWPEPPRPASRSLARWLLAWVALGFALAVIPVLRQRPWGLTLAVAALGAVLGLAFVHRHPLATAHIVRARIQIVGAAGNRGPTLDEDLRLATPFGAAAAGSPELVLPFATDPPPRLLVYDSRELAHLRLDLERQGQGGRVHVRNRNGLNGPVHRAVPLLISRLHMGPAQDLPSLVLQEGSGGLVVLMPAEQPLALHDALLHTRERQLFFPVFDGRSLAAADSGAADLPMTPRRRVMRMLSGEHQPERYATLMGWNTPTPQQKDDLGTLRIYSLANLLRTTP